MKAKDITKKLDKAGATWRPGRGSHRVYTLNECRTVVSMHTGDMPIGTWRSIEKDMEPLRGKEMVEQMTTYKATFTREDDGKWSVSAPDVPGAHSWGRSLKAATLHIREAIASILNSTNEEFDAIVIDPTFHVGDTELDELFIEAQKTRRESRLAQQLALEVLERAVVATQPMDLSMRDVAEMTEVTHSRIQQIEGTITSNRDTYKYDFVDPKGRIVHSGITSDLDRREREHKRELNGKGHIRKVGNKTTRAAAREWEKGKRKA